MNLLKERSHNQFVSTVIQQKAADQYPACDKTNLFKTFSSLVKRYLYPLKALLHIKRIQSILFNLLSKKLINLTQSI